MKHHIKRDENGKIYICINEQTEWKYRPHSWTSELLIKHGIKKLNKIDSKYKRDIK